MSRHLLPFEQALRCTAEFAARSARVLALNRPVPYLARVVFLAAIYFSAAKLALVAAIPPGYATAVWPPSGIALASVLLLGGRIWPGIWLGASLVNVTVQSSLVAATLMGAGNTLEALAGAALGRALIGLPGAFRRGEDVVNSSPSRRPARRSPRRSRRRRSRSCIRWNRRSCCGTGGHG